jgi:hypothetical protein
MYESVRKATRKPPAPKDKYSAGPSHYESGGNYNGVIGPVRLPHIVTLIPHSSQLLLQEIQAWRS